MQTITEKSEATLSHFRKLFECTRRLTDRHQCSRCGKSLISQIELRDHEKTCTAN